MKHQKLSSAILIAIEALSLCYLPAGRIDISLKVGPISRSAIHRVNEFTELAMATLSYSRAYFQESSFVMPAIPAIPAIPQRAQAPDAPTILPNGIPKTGLRVQAFEEMDRTISSFMESNSVPGASVTVMKDGKIVYVSGYGWADQSQRKPFAPTTTCRIASVSKSVTALGILKLVEMGKLSLDDKAFSILNFDIPPKLAGKIDLRIMDVTVRNLLNQNSGFGKSFHRAEDNTPDKAVALGLKMPLERIDVIRFSICKPLYTAPGTQFHYSNFNYFVLGQLIEKVAGMKYEDFIQTSIFKPLGLSQFSVARSKESQSALSETKYYDQTNEFGPSVFPADKGKSSSGMYEAYYYESLTPSGGWVGSSIELAKLVAAVSTPGKLIPSAFLT